MKTEMLKVRLTLTEPQLGTVPKNKEVYATYIADKAKNKDVSKEEAATVQEIEEKGWTGFMKDDQGLFIYNYMIKGFLKAAGIALKAQGDVKAIKSNIDNLVFIRPRRIHFKKQKQFVNEPDGVIERPLRAETMQGPRVTLARSDYISQGANLDFEALIVTNEKGINPNYIKSLFDYGRLKGLGQFRNGSYGTFTVKYQK